MPRPSRRAAGPPPDTSARRTKPGPVRTACIASGWTWTPASRPSWTLAEDGVGRRSVEPAVRAVSEPTGHQPWRDGPTPLSNCARSRLWRGESVGDATQLLQALRQGHPPYRSQGRPAHDGPSDQRFRRAGQRPNLDRRQTAPGRGPGEAAVSNRGVECSPWAPSSPRSDQTVVLRQAGLAGNWSVGATPRLGRAGRSRSTARP